MGSSRTSPPTEPSTSLDLSAPTRLSTSQLSTRPAPTLSRLCPRLLPPQSTLLLRFQLPLMLLPQLLMLDMLLLLPLLPTLLMLLPLWPMLDMPDMLVSVLPDMDMLHKWFISAAV